MSERDHGRAQLADVASVLSQGSAAQYEIKSPESPDEAKHRRRMELLNWWAGTTAVGLAAAVAFGFGIVYS